jgi:hypothetical protein
MAVCRAIGQSGTVGQGVSLDYAKEWSLSVAHIDLPLFFFVRCCIHSYRCIS